MAECAAALAEAGCPPTPRGARADRERLHVGRAQRRAAEAGPRFPSGHWVVLRTLGAFCAVTVAVVASLDGAGVEGAGASAGAVLVTVTSTALALAETIVSDVADRKSGMYTAARSFLPAVVRLRHRIERKAAAAAVHCAELAERPEPISRTRRIEPALRWPQPPDDLNPALRPALRSQAADLDPGLT